MALIKCKECGHDMSDKAVACPHCGWPNESVKKPVQCQPPVTVYIPDVVSCKYSYGPVIPMDFL